MENPDHGSLLALLVKELSALREEIATARTAEAFKEYVTARQLHALFGMSDRAVARMKKVGLSPVHAGTQQEVFRVSDIKALMERPEPLPGDKTKGRKKKARPR